MAAKNELEDLIKLAQVDLDKASTIDEVSELKSVFLGKNGRLNKLISQFSKDDLREVGRLIKEVKQDLESKFSLKFEQLEKDIKIDLTIPGTPKKVGSLHLVTQAIDEISSIFERLGFVRRRYREIDTDWYAAEGLNIPKDHPARDDQETFYINENIVLTAHTSNGQLREMEHVKSPPIKMINIGKTYRRQSDVSHTPMFHQFEGLLIDKNVTIGDLVGVCTAFAQSYFGKDRQIRLRPHHFQFTEPSFEVDITCDICKGTGVIGEGKCRLCKSGWLELGGAGMVHPNVLRNGGIDPDVYNGFAFGWGVERVLMMKSGVSITDIRDIYSSDVRYLKQF